MHFGSDTGLCSVLLNDQDPASLFRHARITNNHLILLLMRTSVHFSKSLELIQFISLATT